MNTLPDPVRVTDEVEPIVTNMMASPELVRQLEKHLLEMPQLMIEPSHLVHGGMCARTVMLPAGIMATGAELNVNTISVFIGDLTVTTNDGTKRLTGFNVIPANAGFKRAGIVHADTWWTTIWVTDKTDVADIENEVTSEVENIQTRRMALNGTLNKAIEKGN